MDADLMYLALSAALCLLLWIPYILSRVGVWGLMPALSYPTDPPKLPDWARRSHRAHLNMVENLPAFAALVLVAHVAGIEGALVAWGAVLFFWARVVHAVVFIAGIPVVRTLAFAVSWVGMVLIFIAILDGPAEMTGTEG